MNAINSYSEQSQSHKLAVDMWSKGLHYDEYKHYCNKFKLTPVERKLFHKIEKDCQKQMDLELGTLRKLKRNA